MNAPGGAFGVLALPQCWLGGKIYEAGRGASGVA